MFPESGDSARPGKTFEELPEKFCQNYEAWMTNEDERQKGDGELRRIAWAVCAEDRGDLEALVASFENKVCLRVFQSKF